MFPDVRFLYCSTNKNLILSLSIYRDVYSCIFLSYLSKNDKCYFLSWLFVFDLLSCDFLSYIQIMNNTSRKEVLDKGPKYCEPKPINRNINYTIIRRGLLQTMDKTWKKKNIDNLSGWFGLVYGVYHHFQQYFSYTVTVSFIGGGNWSTRRKPPTCRKSLTNFITLCCIGYTSPWAGFKLTTLVVIGTDCTGSCKSKHHTQHIRNVEHLKI